MKTIHKATRGKHSTLKLAYAAGFIDGEGSIMITRTIIKKSGNYQYLLRASAVNTDKDIIQWLYDEFSGFRPVELIKKHRINPRHRMTYQWLISGHDALEFIKLLSPYLKVKKQQAKLAIKFQERKERERKDINGKKVPAHKQFWREKCHQNMRKLNLKEKYYLQPQRLSEEKPKG